MLEENKSISPQNNQKQALFSSPLGKILIKVDSQHLISCLFVDHKFNQHDTKNKKITLLSSCHVPLFEQIEAQLTDYFHGRADIGGAFPLTLKGTAFQQTVWKAILRVPAGQTKSYLEIAQQITRPKANRAVANACAQNSLALFVPCHRIVNSQNQTTGYRWDINRALYLLELEKHYFEKTLR